MEWRERLRLDSDACLARLVTSRAGFDTDAHQPEYRGGTHYVTFGRFKGRPAVFKYFVAPRRWRNEVACLRLLRETGLVPRVFYEEPESLIVMERLDGVDVLHPLETNALTRERAGELSQAVGSALGRLVAFRPPSGAAGYDPMTHFPDWGWSEGFPKIIERCLDVGRKIVESLPPAEVQVLKSSLARIEECAPSFEREPRVLVHEDVSNLRVQGTRFVGLYDLELCRGGTPSMQLGVALGLCEPGHLDWRQLRKSFEDSSGFKIDPTSALAMHHLSRWIRIVAHDEPARAVADARERLGEMAEAERTIQQAES